MKKQEYLKSLKLALLCSSMLSIVVFIAHIILGYDLLFDICILVTIALGGIAYLFVKKTIVLNIYLAIYGLLNIIAAAFTLTDSSGTVTWKEQLSNILYAIVLVTYAAIYFISIKMRHNKMIKNQEK